jgi:asparagine N-glycosylation enzyme membrane subunit Stt3
MIGSLFPVFVDFLLYFIGASQQYQFIGHSIFFTIILFFLVMITTKRGSLLRSNALLFSIGSFFYLVLSFTWLNQQVILYPFFEESKDNFSLAHNLEFLLGLVGLFYMLLKTRNFATLKIFIKTGKFTY